VDTNVSEEHAAFMFMTEISRVGMQLNYTHRLQGRWSLTEGEEEIELCPDQ
jgi:hypothetical protein